MEAVAAKLAHGKHATVDDTVRANMALVRKVIAKHFPHHERYGATADDVLQLGALGLARAHATHDPEKGAFSTHAFWKIRGEIESGLRSYGKSDYKHLDGRWNHTAISQLGSGDDGPPPVEATASEEDAPEAVAATNELGASLRQMLDCLASRSAEALRLRHIEERTLVDVGRALGVTRERARQLIKKGLEQLRAHFGEQRLAVALAGAVNLMRAGDGPVAEQEQSGTEQRAGLREPEAEAMPGVRRSGAQASGE